MAATPRAEFSRRPLGGRTGWTQARSMLATVVWFEKLCAALVLSVVGVSPATAEAPTPDPVVIEATAAAGELAPSDAAGG